MGCGWVVAGAVWSAALLVLGSLVVLLAYRTGWLAPQLGWRVAIALGASAAFVATGAGFVALRGVRSLGAVRAIWLNLAELSETQDDADCLGRLEGFAAGEDLPAAGWGWNRLVAAVDGLRDGLADAAGRPDVASFLCSYDAQRLLGLLDSLNDGLLLADGRGTVLLANRACEGLLGRSLSEFIGRRLPEVFAGPQAQGVLGTLLGGASCGADHYFEEAMTPPGARPQPGPEVAPTGEVCKPSDLAAWAARGGTILWVRCHRLGEGKEGDELLLTLRDITQQRIGEASRDAFIAHVSHELRSPLTNIRAYAETLMSDLILDAAGQKEAFNVINEETSRLLRLVNDILELSRMEGGALRLDKGEVVLDRLIRQCVQDVKGMAAARKIALETSYHPKLPNLWADREKLAVVINNLLSNAIKYTPEGGTVLVETNVDDRFVYAKVTDTGYGLTPEDGERIFEKFYRVPRPETAATPGSGLGLAICKEIVQLHGGTIHVTSELNKGTEMEVRLPLTEVGPVLGPAVKAEPA